MPPAQYEPPAVQLAIDAAAPADLLPDVEGQEERTGGTGWGGSGAERGTGKGLGCRPVHRRRHGRHSLAIAGLLAAGRHRPSCRARPGRPRPAGPCGVLMRPRACLDGRHRPSRARRKQGWRGRWGSPTRAPRPATPSDPGLPARPEHLSNAQPGPDISGLARTCVRVRILNLFVMQHK